MSLDFWRPNWPRGPGPPFGLDLPPEAAVDLTVATATITALIAEANFVAGVLSVTLLLRTAKSIVLSLRR